MKKYWKIEFTEGLEGFGWLEFDADSMVETGLYSDAGDLIAEPVCYHPIEFDSTPAWAA